MKVYDIEDILKGKLSRIIEGEVITEAENYFARFFFSKKQPGVYFDVGVRDDSHVANTLMSPNGEFHLFEPHPEYCNIAESKYSPYKNVKINNFALGSKNETRHYYEKSQGFINLQESWESLGYVPNNLPIKTLDSYCEENNITNIDFLKIDTEGFEKEVLLGGSEILKNGTICVQFEYGTTWKDQEPSVSLFDVLDKFFNGWYLYVLQNKRILRFDQSSQEVKNLLLSFNYINFIASKIDLGRLCNLINQELQGIHTG